MKEKVYNYLLESAGSYYDWGTRSYVSFYHSYVNGNPPSFGLNQPTYREIAKALGIKQSQVREIMEQLIKEGRAKRPTWTKKIGTLKYRDEDGRIKTVSVYSGGDVYFVLVYDFCGKSEIVDIFDRDYRFQNSFDTWLLNNDGTPYMINDRKLYGKDDWLGWEININDSAWPGAIINRELSRYGKTYNVKTYDKKV